ncbi:MULTISPECIES: family 10 glycosylhydrolase [unclassified Leptolyngbya]|uniref:glycoside hydrolase family 10 protein n=1 Tax=unclassified Leptolyngbya TaxID=2650499 RepID=UPI001682FDE6|nr:MULTISPECIES: family 10 glycosylhydrolase [unclassified Leptolyngbya]MBD1909239.1 family 10 glycosylhydrolase [Leptolyngbya sp. FACHB-8]MBD2156595.1 family 10 glycosylhydrolase [Leptolyngbya sp. FACHB-16]
MPVNHPSKSIQRSRLPWCSSFLLLLCSLALVLTLWQAPTVRHSAGASTELRGVWMTDIGAALMYYTTRLDDAIANLAKQDLNTLYPSVWNSGATLHPSAIVQRASNTDRLWQKLPRPDPLSSLLRQAHRQHVRLIPWFEYGLMIPPQSAIAIAHPDWLSSTRDGKQQDEVNGQSWFNPAHPEVQQFLTDLIVDVAKRYPIDGIQLDDHFAMPIAFGYDAYTVKRYQADHQGQAPPTDARDAEWVAWRAAHVTALMTKIAQAVRAVRPDAVVSLSPNLPDFAYENYLQDWSRWIDLGLLDEVVVQVYRSESSAFANELSNARLRQVRSQIPVAIGIYTGPFLSPQSLEQIRQQVDHVRQSQYAGVSFFCWETTFWWFRHPSTKGDRIFQE